MTAETTPTPSAPARTAATAALPPQWKLDRDLLVFYGPDPGEAADRLLESGQKRVLIYDPNAEFARTFEQGTALARTPPELMQLVQMICDPPPELMNVRAIPGTPTDAQLQNKLGRILRRSMKAFVTNQATMDSFGGMWLEQLISNLGRIATNPSVQELKQAFGDRPCVIVSPGPSLEQNIHLVREFAGRAVIMTCTHALRALEQVGVVPDIVVVGDAAALEWQYADYDFTRVTALVQMAGGHDDIYELPTKHVFTYGHSPDVDLWAYAVLGKQAFLASGGSVACVELSLANLLGCPEVVYVGQDLAFAGERYYASSVRDGQARAKRTEDGQSFVLERKLPVDEFNRKGADTWIAPSQRVLEVPGYYGGTVETAYTFTIFLEWFALILKSDTCKARVFNCTEGGAYIDGMLHVPLERMLARLPGEDLPSVSDVIEKRLAEWDDGDARARMSMFIEATQERLDRCERLLKECRRLTKKARKQRRYLEALGRAEQEMLELLEKLSFASMASNEEIRTIGAEAQQAQSVDESLDTAERLYRVIARTVAAVRPPLAIAQRDLEGESEAAAAA